MRSSTVEKTVIAIEAIRDHFKTDIINTKQLNSFKENRPEVYIPVAFYHNCKTERATYDLNKFNAEAVSEKTQTAYSVETLRKAIEETDEEIEARINMRFQVMDTMVAAAIQGNCRSLIVYGPAGCGKSSSILREIQNIPAERVTILSGQVTPTGLFRALWKNRFANHVLVLDDADSVFDKETSMNILKKACDSTDDRYISWESNKNQIDEDGEEIPYTFEFCGSVVFLTNKNLRELGEKENAMAPHFKALQSRSHYIDLSINSVREKMIRMKWVVRNTSMLEDIDQRTRDEVMQFVEMNQSKMSDLSLRTIKIIANTTISHPDNWRMIVSVTCMK